MLNPFTEVNWNPGVPERRKFAVSLIVGVPCLAAVFALTHWIHHHAWKPGFLWLAATGAALGVILWLLPMIARPFYVACYFFACCVGIVVGNLLFIVFFYLVFTPISLALRLTGRKVFSKTFDRNQATYWRDAEKGGDLKRYYQQF